MLYLYMRIHMQAAVILPFQKKSPTVCWARLLPWCEKRRTNAYTTFIQVLVMKVLGSFAMLLALLICTVYLIA